MDTIKINKKDTKLVAHRGLSGLERENTNAAFVAAGNRSYWGIETDIHKTADGKYVVIHDDDTARVANKNLIVEESTYEELQSLSMKDIDDKTERCDLITPNLEEYISICKKYEKISVLELKNGFLKEDVQEIISIISQLGYIEKTIFISFNINNLVYVKEIRPEQNVQYLTGDCKEKQFEVVLKYNMDIDHDCKTLTKELIDKFHNNGIVVNCWTCDDKLLAEELIAQGVDFITTNILE